MMAATVAMMMMMMMMRMTMTMMAVTMAATMVATTMMAASFFEPRKKASLPADPASVNNEKASAKIPVSAKKHQSPLKEYLSTLAKRLPKIDGQGYFYFTGGTGHLSVQIEKSLLDKA